MTRFGYHSASSPLHDAASVARILGGLAGDLRAAGGSAIASGRTPHGVPAADGADAPLAVVVLTGGTEREILRLVADRPAWEPVLVVAHPWHNSLPAALEVVARLHQDGRPARLQYLDGGPRAVADLAAAAADVAVVRRLHGLTIGLVGEPSDWLVASAPTAEVVRAAWGPTVVPITMDEVLAAYRDAAPDQGAALAAEIAAGAAAGGGAAGAAAGGGAVGASGRHGDAVDRPEPPGRGVLAAAGRVYPALRAVADRHALDAMTVRCFDLVKQLGTTGCLALAELNDAGVTAGCEGDLPSTLAMIWTRLLLDVVPWMANPSQVRPDGLLVLAHCTVARSRTTGYRLAPHFESGQGAALAGALPTGPVTLVRLGGRGLRQSWLAEGEAVTHPVQTGLCHTQLAVRLPADSLAELFTAPLGNHLVAVPGRHRDRLARWLTTTRVPAVD